jgi:hypothetical protein
MPAPIALPSAPVDNIPEPAERIGDEIQAEPDLQVSPMVAASSIVPIVPAPPVLNAAHVAPQTSPPSDTESLAMEENHFHAEEKELDDESLAGYSPHGQVWVPFQGAITQDPRYATGRVPRQTTLLWGGIDKNVYAENSKVPYVKLMFPCPDLPLFLQSTNSRLRQSDPELGHVEFWAWFALWGSMTLVRTHGGRGAYWETKSEGIYPGADFGRWGIS